MFDCPRVYLRNEPVLPETPNECLLRLIEEVDTFRGRIASGGSLTLGQYDQAILAALELGGIGAPTV